jgi:hypothetical protein
MVFLFLARSGTFLTKLPERLDTDLCLPSGLPHDQPSTNRAWQGSKLTTPRATHEVEGIPTKKYKSGVTMLKAYHTTRSR